jgi:glycosyltransferase involved in cell wall biosynthesis
LSSISIIIPTFNSAKYLPDAIQSCLAQTHKDIQIIIVDDGSTDNTREIVEQFPVAYLYQANQGAAVARNNGWRMANAEYFQFLDADDILLPTKIERSLQAFAPDVDVVYTNYEYRSLDLTEKLLTPHTITPEGNILEHSLNSTRSLFPIHAALIRRSTAERTRRFNERMALAEDWYFWIELASQGAKFRYLDEVLVWYRMTPGSLSKDTMKMSQARLVGAEALSQLHLPENFDLNQFIAERHHMLGIRYWTAGNRLEARKHFQHAIKQSPNMRRRHLARYYLILMTYFSRVQSAESFLNRVAKLFNKT